MISLYVSFQLCHPLAPIITATADQSPQQPLTRQPEEMRGESQQRKAEKV